MTVNMIVKSSGFVQRTVSNFAQAKESNRNKPLGIRKSRYNPKCEIS